MSGADAFAVALLDWLGETTLHVATLVLVVGALVLFLGRRLTPRWRFALWGLVAVRLLLPVVPASPFSIHNVRLPRARAETARVAASEPGVPLAPDALPTTLPTAASSAPKPPASPPRTSYDASLPALPAARAPEIVQRAESGRTWPLAALVLWLAGTLAIGAWWLLAEARFRRCLRGAAEVPDPGVARALETACREAGVRRPPLVLATDAVAAPALAGVLRPRLLLPTRLVGALSEPELLCVFRHELAHLRGGDVLVNWVLAGLTALHWFNPLVWFAFGRLRAERESVRDWAALAHAERAGTDDDQRVTYGETLLRLLQHGGKRVRPRPVAVGIFENKREMRRRITMIATFRRGGLKGRFLGAGVVVVAAAAALTGATLDTLPAAAQDASAAASGTGPAQPATALRRIHVERETAPDALDAAVRAKLQGGAVAPEGGSTTLLELVGKLRAATGVNVVISRDAREQSEGEDLALPAGASITAEQQLRLGLRQVGLAFAVRDGAVFVGAEYETIGAIDRRFYDVRPIVDQVRQRIIDGARVDQPFEEVETYALQFGSDDVIGLVLGFDEHADDWAREGTSIAALGDLLVVTQSDDVHARTEAFLDQLLNRGEPRVRPLDAWKVRLLTALGSVVSLDVEDVPLSDAAVILGNATGVTIVAEGECGEQPITLALESVPARKAVEWCARLAHVHVALRDGVVVFSSRPDTEVRIYDVHDIVTARKGSVPLDALIEMTTQIAPETWEEFAMAEGWDELLIVRNAPSVHERIDNLLATVRRALGDGGKRPR